MLKIRAKNSVFQDKVIIVKMNILRNKIIINIILNYFINKL